MDQSADNSPRKNTDELRARVAELERLVADLQSLIQLADPHPIVYPANASQSKFWQELICNGGTLTNLGASAVGGDIVGCKETTSGSALLCLADGQGLVVEMEDLTGMRPVWLPNGSFGVYLTQVGGANGDDSSVSGTASYPTYTYNVYADSGKTVLLGGTLTVEWHRQLQVGVSAATHGLAQWNGPTLRLLLTDEYPDRTTCT